MCSGTYKEFCRRVKQQRKPQSKSLLFLAVDNKIMDTPEVICNDWASYFQDLATPTNKEEFDDEAKSFIVSDLEQVMNTCRLMELSHA